MATARRPSVLIVGTAFAVREHRKKLEGLAADFSLTCVTASECHGFGWVESTDEPTSGDYELIGLPIAGASSAGTRSWYRGLARVFRARSYDLILVENEPWGVLRWQSWALKVCFQPRARFGEFTWENVARTGWKGCLLGLIYRLASWSDSFVVAGNQDALALMRRYGTPVQSSTCLAQFGVDADLFHPLPEPARLEARRAAGLPGDTFLIAFCGRFVPEKGVLDLLRAFQGLPGHLNARLLFKGSGPLEAALRQAAQADARIEIHPPSTHPEMARFLQMIDLLVLPSRTATAPAVYWKEQFGHILIEAMACQTLAIGSDCGAIPEVLADSRVIFPEANVEALGALITSLMTHREQARQIAADQRQRVLEHYTHERLCRQWADVFYQCLGRMPPARLGEPA